MPWDELYVYGAGGHGKVVADILLATKAQNLRGFIDDGAGPMGRFVLGLPVLGNGEFPRERANHVRVAVALGIGDNQARKAVAAQCAESGIELVIAVHPTAVVAPSARLGPGAVIMANAAVNPDAFVEAGAIVNTCAVVEHDVVIGAYAHISPNASTGGAARLGALAHLGLGAVILPGIKVGTRSIVGAGAVVNRDLADGVVAVGVPARVIRKLGGAA